MVILYEKDEKDFTSFGLGILSDVVSCEVTEELNASFELEMKYPIGGKLYNELKEERIIFCKPNPYSDPQPFRIYEKEVPLEGNIIVNARHIFYDMTNIPTKNLPTNINNIEKALTDINTSIVNDNKFNFILSSPKTDFKTKDFTSLAVPHKLSELIFEDDEESIVNVYDAELKYDKFNCYIYKKRGTNRGLKIEYGKNITSLTQNINSEKYYTGILPYYSQDSTQTNSSTTKQYTDIYIVPEVEPFSYGWLSLNPKRNERSSARIDAYADPNLYIIRKSNDDTSEVDNYVNMLVEQTQLIDKDQHWIKIAKEDLPYDPEDPINASKFPEALQHCCIIPDTPITNPNCFYENKPIVPEDPGGLTPKDLNDMKENTKIVEIIAPDEYNFSYQIMFGQYLYVDSYIEGAARDDEQYVGYYYTPAYSYSNRTYDHEKVYPNIKQWKTTFKGLYALKNIETDSPTLNDDWASFDGTTPIKDEDLLDLNTTYIVLNQTVPTQDGGTEPNTKVYQTYYYTKSLLGNKFRFDKNLWETAKRKLKNLVKSTTETVHNVFIRVNKNDDQYPIQPIYFEGFSENDPYKKIAMVNVTSEIKETPISNVDFTEKIDEWINNHKKDYNKIKMELNTSFILLSDDPLYKDILSKEKIEIGDTITIIHSKIGIIDEQRVVSTIYDALSNKYLEISLQKDTEDEVDEI